MDKLEKLGLHLRDNLGVANEALHAGAITKEQWRVLLAVFVPAWEAFEAVAGYSIDVAARRHVDRVLGQPLRDPLS